MAEIKIFHYKKYDPKSAHAYIGFSKNELQVFDTNSQSANQIEYFRVTRHKSTLTIRGITNLLYATAAKKQTPFKNIQILPKFPFSRIYKKYYYSHASKHFTSDWVLRVPAIFFSNNGISCNNFETKIFTTRLSRNEITIYGAIKYFAATRRKTMRVRESRDQMTDKDVSKQTQTQTFPFIKNKNDYVSCHIKVQPVPATTTNNKRVYLVLNMDYKLRKKLFPEEYVRVTGTLLNGLKLIKATKMEQLLMRATPEYLEHKETILKINNVSKNTAKLYLVKDFIGITNFGKNTRTVQTDATIDWQNCSLNLKPIDMMNAIIPQVSTTPLHKRNEEVFQVTNHTFPTSKLLDVPTNGGTQQKSPVNVVLDNIVLSLPKLNELITYLNRWKDTGDVTFSLNDQNDLGLQIKVGITDKHTRN